ncbi:MAG: hypothetical protein RBG13Loki_2576 [Promethearchaeota archaeon CR_4]|nr:MAG: hypothetical protein RBG13Loki_2576 [Candidatus Lokiarchaeota archaeon CR_4]
MGMLYAYIFCLAVNLFYGILRWMEVANILPPINVAFVTLRLYLLLIMGIVMGVSIFIGRTRWFQTARKFLVESPEEGTGNQQDTMLEQSSRPDPKHKPPKKKSPRIWRIFELSVFISTGILLLLSFLKQSSVCMQLFPTGCYTLPIFSEYPILGVIVDALGELDLVFLLAYGAIKLPLLSRNVMDQSSRVYIGKWHVHESVFGIVWVIIAAFWILFGDYFELFIGFVFALQGAFLIGRDHVDVEKFHFIEKDVAGG